MWGGGGGTKEEREKNFKRGDLKQNKDNGSVGVSQASIDANDGCLISL